MMKYWFSDKRTWATIKVVAESVDDAFAVAYQQAGHKDVVLYGACSV